MVAAEAFRGPTTHSTTTTSRRMVSTLLRPKAFMKTDTSWPKPMELRASDPHMANMIMGATLKNFLARGLKKPFQPAASWGRCFLPSNSTPRMISTGTQMMMSMALTPLAPKWLCRSIWEMGPVVKSNGIITPTKIIREPHFSLMVVQKLGTSSSFRASMWYRRMKYEVNSSRYSTP